MRVSWRKFWKSERYPAAIGVTNADVKRKMSNFPLRRRGSKPMPKLDLQLAITIIK